MDRVPEMKSPFVRSSLACVVKSALLWLSQWQALINQALTGMVATREVKRRPLRGLPVLNRGVKLIMLQVLNAHSRPVYFRGIVRDDWLAEKGLKSGVCAPATAVRMQRKG